MKASLKLRDEQKPLFRAKVPINILGFPFQSGIVAGESKELSLNLTTFFDSGPSFKFEYRPNDSSNPFSLIFKTGIGHFGSPISSPMTMAAEFNFIGGQNPSFFINLKPKFGDFKVKKSQTSVLQKDTKGVSDDDGSVMVENPVLGYKKFTVLPLESSPAVGMVRNVCEDIEVSATTAVPMKKYANLNFRWGFKFSAVAAAGRSDAISFERLPMLVMNKIGIEHLARYEPKDSNKDVGPGGGDVAGSYLDVKKQLEIIQSENGMIRKAMEDFKSEFFAGKKLNEASGFGGQRMEGEMSEEVKKGLKGTAGA